MCIVIRLLMVGAAAIAGQPALASAQPADQGQKTAGWILTPSIGFGGSWDDNILLVNPGDNPPHDYATPINPTLQLDYLGRRTRFSSGYDGSLLMYRTFGELNSAEHQIRATVNHRVTPRLTIVGGENFTQAPTTDVLEVSGLPFYRIGSRSNAVTGGVEALVARHTTLKGMYTLHHVTFEDDNRPGGILQGGHAHEALLSVGRALSRRLVIGGQYELRHAVLAEGQDRFNIHSSGMTVQFEASPAVTISGALGIARMGAGLTHEAQTGPAIRAGISRRGQKATVAASYDRSFIPSFGFGGTFQNQEWMASVHVPFARNRAYTDGSVAWFINDPFESAQPSIKSLWLSGTVGYRATRWLNLEGFYGRSRQDTQRAGGQLDRNQLGFRVVAVKPVRLR